MDLNTLKSKIEDENVSPTVMSDEIKTKFKEVIFSRVNEFFHNSMKDYVNFTDNLFEKNPFLLKTDIYKKIIDFDFFIENNRRFWSSVIQYSVIDKTFFIEDDCYEEIVEKFPDIEQIKSAEINIVLGGTNQLYHEYFIDFFYPTIIDKLGFNYDTVENLLYHILPDSFFDFMYSSHKTEESFLKDFQEEIKKHDFNVRKMKFERECHKIEMKFRRAFSFFTENKNFENLIEEVQKASKAFPDISFDGFSLKKTGINIYKDGDNWIILPFSTKEKSLEEFKKDFKVFINDLRSKIDGEGFLATVLDKYITVNDFTVINIETNNRYYNDYVLSLILKDNPNSDLLKKLIYNYEYEPDAKMLVEDLYSVILKLTGVPDSSNNKKKLKEIVEEEIQKLESKFSISI